MPSRCSIFLVIGVFSIVCSSFSASSAGVHEVWNRRLKSGFPPEWEHQTEYPKPWTEEERKRVLDALSVLPEQLLVNSVEGIYRFRRHHSEASNPAAGYRNQIALYDRAFLPGASLSRILAHEFAHKLYSQFFGTDRGRGYAEVAEWRSFVNPRTREQYLTTFRTEFVEEDGINGPGEDFSNNIEYFLFDPQRLKSKSPRIFDWIRKRYGAKFSLRKGAK